MNVFDGRVVMEGPMLAGVPFELGPAAVVRVGGIDIVLGSRRVQNFDQMYFKAAGIDPANAAFSASSRCSTFVRPMRRSREKSWSSTTAMAAARNASTVCRSPTCAGRSFRWIWS